MNWSKTSQTITWLLRLAMGWMFVYDGYFKLTSDNWSPLGYIQNAQTFSGFYDWLALPGNLPWVTFFNIWGPILIGAALVIGFRVRWATVFGITLMMLYYFPILQFPLVASGGYIVDRHIIYALVLALLYSVNAGEFWGLDAKVQVIVKTQ